MKRICLIAACAALFLYSCGNSQSESNDSAPVASKPKETGEDIYKRTCVACHQATGDGVPGAFPPLAKSDYLADKEATIKQVLKGGTGEMTVNGKTYNGVMPPQALEDGEIASVLTYVYCNFGNNACTITPDEVKAVRAKM